MEEYTCPQCGGASDAEYAEANWHHVDGELCCSAYCRALEDGFSEEVAQEARGAHTEVSAGALREQRVAEARAILEAEGAEFFDAEDEAFEKKTASAELETDNREEEEL